MRPAADVSGGMVLGGFGARRDSGPGPIHGLKLQGLLALLALSAPAPVPDGRLIDELWGDDDLADPSTLSMPRSRYCRALGRDLVVCARVSGMAWSSMRKARVEDGRGL